MLMLVGVHCNLLVFCFVPGVSLMQSSTRARPNAFHFRRQVMVLQRAGGGNSDRLFEDSRTQLFESHLHYV